MFKFFAKKVEVPESLATKVVEAVQLWEVRWYSYHGGFLGLKYPDHREQLEAFPSEELAQAFAVALLCQNTPTPLAPIRGCNCCACVEMRESPVKASGSEPGVNWPGEYCPTDRELDCQSPREMLEDFLPELDAITSSEWKEPIHVSDVEKLQRAANSVSDRIRAALKTDAGPT